MTPDPQAAPLSVEEIPCAFFPAEKKKRLDPFERTDMWRRAQEQLKQPHLEMLKRLIAEQHYDYRRAEDWKDRAEAAESALKASKPVGMTREERATLDRAKKILRTADACITADELGFLIDRLYQPSVDTAAQEKETKL